MVDAFPRSRTIAFNDEEDDGLEHDYQPRGFSSAREGGFMPRSATVRSQDSTLPILIRNVADKQFHVLRPEQHPPPFQERTLYAPPSLSDPIPECLGLEGSPPHLSLYEWLSTDSFPKLP
jgi:hypothetical protein